MHEVARFNQTFYPYACVLFSADCAVRRDMRYAATAALGPATTGWRWTCGRLCRWCHRCGLVGLR
ncbi:hypothetical protein FDU21_17515 [Xanthomonas oryzae pv. oryzae]|nr:hypothetical protein FDU21_17515 [Xanthomonas oryzae pv. oryzae]